MHALTYVTHNINECHLEICSCSFLPFTRFTFLTSGLLARPLGADDSPRLPLHGRERFTPYSNIKYHADGQDHKPVSFSWKSAKRPPVRTEKSNIVLRGKKAVVGNTARYFTTTNKEHRDDSNGYTSSDIIVGL